MKIESNKNWTTCLRLNTGDGSPRVFLLNSHFLGSVPYVDGNFVFENEEEAKKLWPQGKFLFQELQLNKDILAKAKLRENIYTKKEESPTGDNTFYLKYSIQLPVVSRILGIDESQPVELFIFGRDESDGFVYEIGTEQDNQTTLWEMIREIRK